MDAGDLYQERMVRLAREAHGAGHLDAPDATVTLDNPLCGDRVTIEVQLRDGRVAAVAHHVRGCVLCEAAASLIGRAARGATREDIDVARGALGDILRAGADAPAGPWSDLSVFTPVRSVPSRHGCALLPFEALHRAVAQGT